MEKMKKTLEVVEGEAVEVGPGVEEKTEEKNQIQVSSEKKTLSTSVDENKTLPASPFDSEQSFNSYFTMAKYLSQSDMVPESYQKKPMNCMIALEQAKRMNASPLMVMQNLYIVKGKPSWSGQACSMIVNGCGLFKDVDLVYVGERGKDTWGAYVKAIRLSDGKEIHGTTVTMDMAKKEGWSKNSKWQSMPEQMLGYRAYSFFARLYCPNALSGFKTEGEIEDVQASRASNVENPF